MTEAPPHSGSGPVAVFGGTFDPVHRGHLDMAAEICRQGLARRVILLPAARPPHKLRRPVTADRHRLAMLALAAASGDHLAVSTCELDRDAVSYTIHSAAYFAAIHGDNLRLLIGADSLGDLPDWYRGEELVRRYRFLIYGRPGHPLPAAAALAARLGPELAAKLLAGVVTGPLSPISATAVRQAIAAGKDVSGLLCEPVRRYIHEHGLYRPATAPGPPAQAE